MADGRFRPELAASNSLQRQGDPLPHPDAEGGDGPLAAAPLQFVQRRSARAGAAHAQADGRARWRRRCGFTCSASSGRPRPRSTASAWLANASFSSITSKSPIFSPVAPAASRTAGHRADAHDPRRDAGRGHAEHPRARASGPCALAAASDGRIIAAAPSLTPEALPAVTVPPACGTASSAPPAPPAWCRRADVRRPSTMTGLPLRVLGRHRQRSPRRKSRSAARAGALLAAHRRRRPGRRG